MRILVDTTIWSLALRRHGGSLSPAEHRLVTEWASLVRKARVGIIGPIRQEILSGVRTKVQFELLRARLAAFHNTPVDELDYETAAQFFNTCRRHGIAGSPIDMLICAVSARVAWPIFTTDNDFTHYAARLPIRLHSRAE